MTSGAQYRPPPPHDLESRRYAEDFNELKSLGSLESTTRDRDQTEAAFFWFEGSPIRWNRIARTASSAAGLDLWANAWLFGLLNISLADGYIGNWDAKQHYNRWRPETAVRQAGRDGNPRTVADPEWLPLWGSSGATPEYDSGHTIEGAAAAVVLADVFGTDDVSFEICSYSFQDPELNCDGATPVVRDYDSFSEAAYRERALPHLARLALPQCRRARVPARRADRQPRRAPLLPARGLGDCCRHPECVAGGSVGSTSSSTCSRRPRIPSTRDGTPGGRWFGTR